MTRLLVSVRSAEEAEAALAGGADLIDVKEPALGSLGRADEATLAAVVCAVAGRRPVSAALGDLRPGTRPVLPTVLPELAFIKWGLAGCAAGGPAPWQDALEAIGACMAETAANCDMAVVAYADWKRARAPSPEEVFAFAQLRGTALLIDTWHKDGTTLLDWMSVAEIDEWCQRCRATHTALALAGALDRAALLRLRHAAPDWLAVRGAVCRGGQRAGILDEDRVRQLAMLVADTSP